jgi:hypothetical protein
VFGDAGGSVGDLRHADQGCKDQPRGDAEDGEEVRELDRRILEVLDESP